MRQRSDVPGRTAAQDTAGGNAAGEGARIALLNEEERKEMDRTGQKYGFCGVGSFAGVPGLFCGWLMLSVMRGEWICLI